MLLATHRRDPQAVLIGALSESWGYPNQRHSVTVVTIPFLNNQPVERLEEPHTVDASVRGDMAEMRFDYVSREAAAFITIDGLMPAQ